MSRKLWLPVITLVFLFVTLAGGTGLLAQTEKPATPDTQPREVPDQEVRIDVLPETRDAVSPRAAILTEGFEGAWPAGLWATGDFSSNDGGEYLWDDSNCWPHTGQWGAYSVGGGAAGNQLPCWGPYPNNVNT